MSANDRRTTFAAAATTRSLPPTAGLIPLSETLDVTYSCGSCGYILNLISCNRTTENMDSSYRKVIKKGMISFFTIDESRFCTKDQLFFKPYFRSKRSWGLFRRRKKLLCRKCGNHIGNAYNDHISPGKSTNLDRIAGSKKYSIKISALQPS